MGREIGLQQGTQARLDAGMKIGLVDVIEGEGDGLPSVILFVKDDGERDVTLCPGDTFSIGDQTWALERVNFGGTRPGAVFSRLE
ncbi:DUF6406 domain-containing protein [Actinomadura sp. B10D3]|uniref:DUF6406 domain-containing protein n=1 Tax=Actinomadura sp. B10D3 TaxID=3153557 RepID=UPI00325D589F